jgi:hypothetical protein
VEKSPFHCERGEKPVRQKIDAISLMAMVVLSVAIPAFANTKTYSWTMNYR